jgi:diketogulonate reductase-like aldo/keto reductase
MLSPIDVRGALVPGFIYGTAWKEDRTQALVEEALRRGFRGIDTANQRKHYHEEGVGRAIAAAIARGEVTRDELFLQTKFTSLDGQDHRLPYDAAAPVADQVVQSFESSLRHLGVDRLDSLVLHGPTLHEGLADEDLEAWRAMEALHDAGRVRLLGVSNVSAAQLEAFCSEARVSPAFVQNRCFARLRWDARVRAGCAARGVVYQGFSLLTANQHLFRSPLLQRVAEGHARTPSQVIFRLAIQLGMIPLSGTSDPAHMGLDLAVDRFSLAEDEVAALVAIDAR